jgi:transposase
MRKGYNGLQALVENDFRHDVTAGQLYLFVARNQKRAKVLFWDGTGLCIYMKRLEAGCFIAPWERDVPTMTVSELALFLEGSVALKSTSLSPSPFFVQPLGSTNLQAG